MKKKQVKALSELAKQLPASKEIVKYSIGKMGYEITVEEAEKADIEIQHDQLYISKNNYKIVDVNHLDRLKKAFAKNKEQGLVDYIFWVDKNNRKMNELFENMKLKQVNENIMQIAIKGASNFWKNIWIFLISLISVFGAKNNAK